MAAGDCCYFPPDVPHVFTVTSDQPARLLVIYTPPYEESPDRVIRGFPRPRRLTRRPPAVAAAEAARAIPPRRPAMKPSRLLGAALLPARPCCPAAVRAADYPAKPITLIVPFPAGSGTDAVGRIFGNELSSILGQQVIVENKPGANATIAASLVARARPDGYDLRHHQHLALGRALADEERALRPVKDFTPIARGGNLPFILVANPKRPWKTVADLVTDARQRPGASPMPAATHRHRGRRHAGPPRQYRHPARAL